jgi:isoquinoline 1-oxidoreductase subunit alpha
MSRFTLLVNGQSHTVDVAPDTPLLWVLRDHLDLVGTKYGCGMGLCGSCNVHVDGQIARSCITPISNVGERAVTTIEGLDPAGQHPLQKAWIEHDVAQCGYCQAGQIMTAAALLAQNPQPTTSDIGTYLRIRSAIHAAAGQAHTPTT